MTRATTYDLIPYTNHPFLETHPDSLATVASLFGMSPPRVECCRVLEMGCGRGGNLIPMALGLPEARFLGIDNSPRQIAEGQSEVEALGLSNIELRAQSILEVDESFGQFDYIICHGVYSWVPAEVRDKILAICSQNLAPAGIALVSYNTYPGWHVKGMIREMIAFYVQKFSDPHEQLEQARTFLDILVESVWDPSGVYAGFLREEAQRLRKEVDEYLFHEYLEEVNQPVYFHEFAGRAAAQGLQHLGDARFGSMAVNRPASLRATLERLSADPIQREQYLDFLRSRSFRRSLLCHDDIKLRSEPCAQAVEGLRAIALVAPEALEPDARSTPTEPFGTIAGASGPIDQPLLKAALVVLRDHWPLSVSYAALRAGLQSRLAGLGDSAATPIDRDFRRLEEALLWAYGAGWIELHVHVPHYVREVSERPLASPLARHQAKSSTWVVSLRHHLIELNRLDRHVLRRLDGRHDRAALIDMVAGLVAEGALEIKGVVQPFKDPARIRAIAADSLDLCLRRMAASAILIG